MLIVGYCYGIRSERRLCEEVDLHLAYRWFCCLDLDDQVPDHSTFSVNRHGRFRDSDKANKRLQFGYGLNYLIDLAHAIIVDVEPTPARSSDEVASTKTMLVRTERCFGLKPKRLAADTAYGTAKFIDWLIGARIAPHIPVWDKSDRDWQQIDVGQLVLAKDDGPWGSWWEAVPIEKAGDEFKLRWRDYSRIAPITRQRLVLALICPDAT
jgi:Transposase domain (DUF772)/Transposase DDE domain